MSAPRAGPYRWPIVWLVAALIAWAVAATNLLVAVLQPERQTFAVGWGGVGLWTLVGALWFWRWRRGVRARKR